MVYTIEDFEDYTNHAMREICKDYKIKKRTNMRDNKELMIIKVIEYLNENNLIFEDKNIYIKKKYSKNKNTNKSDTSSTKSSKELSNDIIESNDNESIILSDCEDEKENEEKENNEKELNKNENESKNKYELIEYCEENVKILSENKINIIYHISDIHIKPYKNISDFYHFDDVFEKLTNIINNDKREKILVITGDIFDNKEKLTATSLRKFQEYLEKINCDKIIITGNHDKNLNLNDSHDTLIPVLSGYRDIYYLQYTNVYRYGEIDFYVNSLLDEKIIRIEEKTNKYNIALYHGMVRPTMRENLDNFHRRPLKINNNDEKIQNITNLGFFDYALLGDIHKHQYLDTTKTAWYASSLVQKDFGENILQHGYMLLDLENKEWSFNNIKSDYGYVNIILENNTYILENEIKENLCKNMNVKFKININVENKDKLIEKVKNDLNIIIINKKEEIILDRNNIINNNTIKEIGNRQVLNEEEELKKYIIKNKERLEILLKDNITEEIINEIIGLHKENLKNFDNNRKGNKFILEFIEFKNIMNYGTGDINKVNFNNGLSLLQGTNMIGKTTFLKLIQFGLFGINSDIETLYDVVNKNVRTTINDNYIHIGFIINNDKYIIERNKILIKEKKIKGKMSYQGEYGNICLKKNNNIITKDKNQLDKEIINLIDTCDNFKNLSLINDNEKGNFIKTTNQQRLLQFEKLLGLNKYIDFENDIKNKITSIRKNYNLLKGQIEENKKNIKELNMNIIDDIKENLINLGKEYNILKEKNTKNKKELEIRENKIKELIKDLIPLEEVEEVDINDKDNIINKIDKINKELEILNNDIIILKNIDKINENKLIKEDVDYEKYNKDYIKIDNEISKINKEEINKLVNKKEVYQYVEKVNIEEFLINYKENISKLEKLNKEKHEYEIILKKYNKQLKIINEETYNNYKLKLEEIDKIYNKEILEQLKYKTNILNLEDIEIKDIDKQHNEIIILEKEINKINENINKLKNIEVIEKNKTINEENYKYYKNILDKILKIYDNEISINNYNGTLKDIKDLEIEDMKKIYINLEKYKEEKNNLEKEEYKIGQLDIKINNKYINNENEYNKELKLLEIKKIELEKLNNQLDKIKNDYTKIKTIINEKYKGIKNLKCIINNDNDLCNVEGQITIIKENINNLNKKYLINLLNNDYNKKEIDDIFKQENINIKYLKENIDKIYHYLNNNNKVIDNNKEKLEKDLNNFNKEIEKYKNNKLFIEKIEYENKLVNKEKNKEEIINKIEIYNKKYEEIQKELKNYILNKEIDEKQNKLNDINKRKIELNYLINNLTEQLYNILYYKEFIEKEIIHYKKYQNYLINKGELDNYEKDKKQFINKHDIIIKNMYNIYYYYLELPKDIKLYEETLLYVKTEKDLEDINFKIVNLEKENKNNLSYIENIFNNYIILKDELELYNKNKEYKIKIKELKEKELRYIQNNKLKEIYILELDKINKFEKYINNKNSNIKYEKEIELLNNEINKLQENINIEKENSIIMEIKLQEKDLSIINTEIINNENKKTDLKDKEEELKNIKLKLNINELYKIIINGNEYPSILLELYIVQIEKELNNNIHYFMDDKIRLKKENKKLELYKENKNGGRISLLHSSNYEQLIICSLIKLILKNNNIYSTSDILMIDEVIDDINEENYHKLKLLMEVLHKNYRKMIIVTHNDKIKSLLKNLEIENHEINIQIKNERSYIK
jgi:hypothetical protein